MPTNLYGPGDNFDLQNSHVLPALIRKFHEAKAARRAPRSTIWGTGTPRREFLHVDDLADACVFLMQALFAATDIVNVGVGRGRDHPRTGRAGGRAWSASTARIVSDATKPDGTPRKLMDVGKITGLGWHARTPLRDGIEGTYHWFLANQGRFRA